MTVEHNGGQAVPRVGVGVLVMRDGRLLLGKRTGSYGAETWGLPGGHLDFGEEPAECAVRELLEETGLVANRVVAGPWINGFFENKHYVTLFMVASEVTGEPSVMEPDRCLEWRWCSLKGLPQPLFLPLENLLAATRDSDFDKGGTWVEKVFFMSRSSAQSI